VDESVPGLVVVTQTCDIVRSSKNRPFLQVSPLVELQADELEQAKKGLRPRYLYLPAMEDRSLSGDLARIMTVEKALVATWERTPGWKNQSDGRQISKAISRNFGRPAFPDNFVEWVRPFQKRIKKKHGRSTPEGEFLRSLREIRVRAEPSWDSPKPRITFFYILQDASAFEVAASDEVLDTWKSLLSPTPFFNGPDFLLNTLEDLTAQDYVESDPFDLDYLTSSQK